MTILFNGNEELSEKATCTKIVQVQNEGGRAVKRERPIYNLDVILSIGYRVGAEKETVWLTLAEMAELFGVNVDTIGLHLRNIYREEELETSTYEESSVVRFECNRQVKRTIRIYDLDAIIAVGHGVKSRRGLVFRRWASAVLKQ